MKKDDIYSTKELFVTVKIRIQGGIVAARLDVVNGVSSIFMVQSVVTAPKAKKTKQEHSSSSNSRSEKQSGNMFHQFLDQAIEEQEKTPVLCHTTTYGQDCQMQFFHYQSREYHY